MPSISSNTVALHPSFPYFRPRSYGVSNQITYIQEPKPIEEFDYFLEGYNIALISGLRVLGNCESNLWVVHPDFVNITKGRSARNSFLSIPVLLPPFPRSDEPQHVATLLLSSANDGGSLKGCARQIAKDIGSEHFLFRPFGEPTWKLEGTVRPYYRSQLAVGAYTAAGLPSLLEILSAADVRIGGDSCDWLQVKRNAVELQLLQRAGSSTYMSRKLHEIYYSFPRQDG